MTKEELESLCVHDLTFETEDKNGKIRFWRTTGKFDHSSICDGIEDNDLEEIEDWKEIKI